MSASSNSKITKGIAELSGSSASATKRPRISGELALNSEYVDGSKFHSDAEDIGSIKRDWVEESDYNRIKTASIPLEMLFVQF
jgi:hypothetical protein